ncbi:MAG: SpoIIE family protein phosphatase [Salinivirgaceae bacterium]|nr:SpoIIE family protein phosphatase [Salinivirgaceae bacterium]
MIAEDWGDTRLNNVKHIFAIITGLCLALALQVKAQPANDEYAKFQPEIEKGNRQLAMNHYDKAEELLLNVFDNATDSRVRMEASFKLGELYLMTGDTRKARYYAQLTLNNKAINDSIKLKFKANTLIASIYLRMNEVALCDTFVRRNLAIYNDIDDERDLALFDYTMGKMKLRQNELQPGLKLLKKATNVYQTNIVSADYGKILLQLSRLHRYRNDFSAATQNAEEAELIFERTNFKLGQVEALCIVGNIRLQIGDYDDAWDHFSKAKNISDTLNILKAKMLTSLGLTNWYLSQDNINMALKYYREASASNCAADYSSLFATCLYFSKYYIRHNDLDAALFYLDKAREDGYSEYMWENAHTVYKMYGDIYLKRNNPKKAAEYFSQSLAYGDSLLLSVRQMTTDTLTLTAEYNRQNSLIRYLTNEDEAQKRTISDNMSVIHKQRSSIMSFVGLFLIFTLLMFMLAWSFLIKFRDNKLLQETNERIVQQKEEIEAQRQRLYEYNQELERLSIIARETNNAIRIFDSNGNTTWVNPGYTRLHGFTLEDLQADGSLGLGNTDIKYLLRNWDFNNQSIEFESEIKNKWNLKIWVQTTLSPVIDEDTLSIKSLIAIDTNITSMKQSQREMIAMNKEITDSITYAKRIQEGFLPPFDILTQHYPNSFQFYRPRAIVSGDFYWITEQDGRLIVACADSTGHGVPGAFLSLIGISFLSKIVNERRVVQPSTILNRLRMNIIEHLHQSDSDMTAGDGIDMTLISIDKTSNIMEFSGAMNPIYIIRDGRIIELRPDRMPVGYFDNENRSFSTSRLQLKQGDQIYMFSDGYYDQFGGEGGLKMKTSKFKQILQTCCKRDNKTQIRILEKEFNEWRGRYEQVDDIIIIGIQID